MMLNHP